MKESPLTAILHIDIPLPGPLTNDGSVICSKYSQGALKDVWYFTTLTAPFFADTDGTHPVSGTRAFGIKTGINGEYTIFTRGVDRVRYRSLEFLAAHLTSQPFAAADNLWNAFQDNLVSFIQNNGGQATKIVVQPQRFDIDKVHDYLFGN